MREQIDTGDRVIAKVAARQHGVVTSRQLNAAGIDKSGVARRVAAGRLHRFYRGVYAVGHRRLSNCGRWMAAVLAYGRGAVVSHRSAAELWGMLPPRAGPVHVTAGASGGRSKRAGIHLHRSPPLPNDQTTRHDGIPVTTPARTVADLRRVATVDEVRRAIRRAEFLGLEVGGEAAREPALTRSRLERRFLLMCRRHHLPEPEVNVIVGGREVDFLWRDRMLVVETDGYQAHRGHQAFEDDRAKDADLRVLGFTVVRFTYRQVVETWDWVEDTIRALLMTRSAM